MWVTSVDAVQSFSTMTSSVTHVSQFENFVDHAALYFDGDSVESFGAELDLFELG